MLGPHIKWNNRSDSNTCLPAHACLCLCCRPLAAAPRTSGINCCSSWCVMLQPGCLRQMTAQAMQMTARSKPSQLCLTVRQLPLMRSSRQPGLSSCSAVLVATVARPTAAPLFVHFVHPHLRCVHNRCQRRTAVKDCKVLCQPLAHSVACALPQMVILGCGLSTRRSGAQSDGTCNICCCLLPVAE